MCGVWVALEDVQENSGELFVLPGSHRTQRVMSSDLNLEKVSNDYSSYVQFDQRIQEIIQEGKFQEVNYRPKAGEILVWHENLIHGGKRRTNMGVTRRSIVRHYFARGGVAFYDSRGEAATLETLL
jgi:ectoine hydroxylase-related dioxygenase (phytanoyl-CoA dioxygenase family)